MGEFSFSRWSKSFWDPHCWPLPWPINNISTNLRIMPILDKDLGKLKKYTVRNLHFLSKNSTLISRENCRSFWVKTRENVVVLDFLAVDNFDFTRKIVKQNFWWKIRENVTVLSKLNFWTKIWLFEWCAQKVTFVTIKKQNLNSMHFKWFPTKIVVDNVRSW